MILLISLAVLSAGAVWLTAEVINAFFFGPDDESR